jgi:hypothetical protein
MKARYCLLAGARLDHILVIGKLVLRSDSRPRMADSVWM